MKSMTGYGRATAELAGFSLTVVVSSVNRKTLDLTVKMPEEWDSLEPHVGELVRKFASRGKVHVDLELTGGKTATQATWDEAAASEALDRVAAGHRDDMREALTKLGKEIGEDLQKRAADAKTSIRDRLRKQEDELAAKRKKPGEH